MAMKFVGSFLVELIGWLADKIAGKTAKLLSDYARWGSIFSWITTQKMILLKYL